MDSYCNMHMFLENVQSFSIFTAKEAYNQLSNQQSFSAFCKMLSRLEQEGKICRLSRGIYYKSIESVLGFGPAPISTRDIINHYLGSDGLKGVLTGYSLFRKYGLTTQVEKQITIYSSGIDTEIRKLKSVTIHKLSNILDAQEKQCLEFLFILDEMNAIEDLDAGALVRYLREVSSSLPPAAVARTLSSHRFSKRTIAQAKHIYDHFGIRNELNQFLCPVSTYKVLTMEDLYAVA